MTIFRFLLTVTITATVGSTAFAQLVRPGYHVDRHNHVMRDNHGRITSHYRHDVIHRDDVHVVPYFGGSTTHGTYYRRGEISYYSPDSGLTGSVETPPRPEEISFGGFGHVDDLAARLETLMNDLCLDLYYNYSHNPEFLETYNEAYTLLEAAKFIHAAEHQSDREAISSRLGGADALFHHVQDDVRGWTRNHRRQIGTLGILTKMELAESTLHHLMNDVGVAGSVTEEAPVPLDGPEVAPPPSALAPRTVPLR